MSNDDDDLDPTSADTDSSGFLNEDWLATLIGLGILALALFGLIPAGLIW